MCQNYVRDSIETSEIDQNQSSYDATVSYQPLHRGLRRMLAFFR